MFRLRLSTKLMALLAVIMIICQFMMSAWFVWSARQQLLDDHQRHLNNLKVTISRTIVLDLWNFNQDSLELLLAPYRNDPAIRQIVVQTIRDEKLVVNTDRPADSNPASWLQLPAQQFIEAVILPINHVNTEVGLLQLVEDTGYIHARLMASLQQQLTLLLILLLLMSLALWLAFNKLVLSPLHKLKKSLDQAAVSPEGMLNNPLLGLADEYEEVAHSIVVLSRRLANDVNMIKQTNQQLQISKEQTEQALTELKSAQNALLQSEKQAALTMLVAGVAHEVNTPLGIIITGSSCIEEELKQLEQDFRCNMLTKSGFSQRVSTMSEAVSLIRHNSDRADALIRNFKLLAQGQSDESVRWFNLTAYLHDVLKSAQLTWPQLTIMDELAPDVQYKAVPGLFHQLLWALLENVITHAYPNQQAGRCLIRLSRHVDGIELTCRDYGEGIAPDDLTKVFDPFFTTKFGSGSNGLGLSIAYRIATKNLNGRIAADSQVGAGSCLTILLPNIPA